MRSLIAICFLLLGACSTMQPVSSGEMKAFEVSLAHSDGKLALAWHGGVSGPDAIHFQWLTANGQPQGAPIPVTDGKTFAYEADLQLVEGDPLLAWYETGPGGTYTAWLTRLGAGGQTLWRRQLTASIGSSRNPVARVGKDAISVAWIETPPDANPTPAVWVGRFGLDGSPIGAPVRAGEASFNTWNLNASLDGAGIFRIVYDAHLNSRANELHMLTIDSASVAHAQLSEDDGFTSAYPDLDISEKGQAALTWFDAKDGNEEIYLKVGALSGLTDGRLLAQRITHTSTDSIGAYLAWNKDRLALVWCDRQEGQQELYAQMFDAAGRPQSEIRRLTDTPGQSSIPSVRASADGFAVAWNEYEALGENAHMGVHYSTAFVLLMR